MNRLGSASSAYLRSAAHQPVDWHPWSAEAFAVARAADRPVLLDVGAVWCHWCHVMDRESYEDPALAAYLNAHFVCVKVDRDERPDVDLRYQRAVHALVGQGGWPLTAFLTPDGDVFHGGTYFPPDGRSGRPGFRSVLERVLDAYRSRRPTVLESAAQLRGHVAGTLTEGAPGAVTPALLEAATERMAQAFDSRHGGFGTRPKFPHPSALDFLLARWWSTGATWMREVVERTLTAMARGGVYDQLGGGFHRYATDERWIVPHFEKMAYDNAELLKVYLHAHAAFGTPLYREVAEGIVRWNLEVMCDLERGGFAASQDADVGLDDDGNYFTWSADEASALLGPEEWEAARRMWDIGTTGEMPHDPRRNVLFVAASGAGIAQAMAIPEPEVTGLLASAGAKLRAARALRPAPVVDRSRYTNWNAMMAEAFLEAAAVLDREDCRAFALQTLERLWAEAWRPDAGMAHRAVPADPEPDSNGDPPMLDDQVQAASAAIAAFEHTGDERWLRRALDVAAMLTASFRDPVGGFFDLAGRGGAGFLSQHAKPIQDNPTPAPNAVAALVFLRLHAVTGDGAHRAEADATLQAFAGGAAEFGVFGATYSRAVDALLHGMTTVVVAETTTSGLIQTALRTYRPHKVVLRAGSPVSPHLSPLTPSLSPPYALLCSGDSCAAPCRTSSELRSAMESFGRTG
jgi:uncharacterized protein YyaL (SSP411 family)